MEIKKITLPIILAALSLVFIITCVALYLHNGKSAKWVARKMKVGGIMLSLTAILSACDPTQVNDEPEITCYMVASSNLIIVETDSTNTITLDLPNKQTIEGEIMSRVSNKFCFTVLDSTERVVQKENISALDGAFDESEEHFKITIDNKLANGNYSLKFYNTDKDSLPEYPIQKINLKIE
jgi:hypothetical protein